MYMQPLLQTGIVNKQWAIFGANRPLNRTRKAVKASLLTLCLLGVASAQSKEGTLLIEVQAPIIADGKQIGSVKLPVGSSVTIVSIESDGILVSRGGGVPFKVRKEAVPSEALLVPTAPPTPIQTPVPVVRQVTPQPTSTPQALVSSSPPTLPFGFVGHPEFDTEAGRQCAGTAFLSRAHDDDTIYLLTVRHLLGPMGGFKQLTPPEKVPYFVRSISLQPLTGGSGTKYPVQGMSVPAASDEHGPLFDLAVFKATTAHRNDALELATQQPALGERVWVFADLEGGISRSIYSHPIKITDNRGPWLIGEFEEPNIVTRGASGAPVLNADGKVVGIFSGHYKKNSTMLAYIISPSLILPIIQKSRSQ